MRSSRPCRGIAPPGPASYNSVVRSYMLNNTIFPSLCFELQDYSRLYPGKRHISKFAHSLAPLCGEG
ncbi:uncharacterized protein BJ212DRAFT_1368103 [Suillus subaureus]|uniref:Uncharacterized protein n=1 Tax=Suillus subaureus TaxID=48587 RepID=A0A9P7JBV9_9AGAM|nr:uncharacterized protein BJ212DRAFT_1368103 [Suillus subaureus]KAG1813369.1 hypothetical protein BJ212DRAFT_1368103 [Suillus subaureus]